MTGALLGAGPSPPPPNPLRISGKVIKNPEEGGVNRSRHPPGHHFISVKPQPHYFSDNWKQACFKEHPSPFPPILLYSTGLHFEHPTRGEWAQNANAFFSIFKFYIFFAFDAFFAFLEFWNFFWDILDVFCVFIL